MDSRNKKPSKTPEPELTQISISVEPELKEAIRKRATAERRSVSAYLCWLAERDIAAAEMQKAKGAFARPDLNHLHKDQGE